VARGADQHKNPQSDIEIAQAATMRPIGQIAEKLGIPDEALSLYGRYKAKVSLDYVSSLKNRPDGKLILVTAITPTPAGEGKTTTTVGLGDALNHIGKKAILCLREPSLGPSFGMKGGAAGGGYAQVVRWKTSTSTSPAISTRSAPPTTCWRRWSTTTSIGATSSASTNAASPGGAAST